MTKSYNMGIEATLAVIGGKWKPVILCYLGNGPQRPGALKRAIEGITQKVLTQQLHELMVDGMIQRKVYPQVPPKVEYMLTDRGKSLRQVLIVMSQWGEQQTAQQQAHGEGISLKRSDYNGELRY